MKKALLVLTLTTLINVATAFGQGGGPVWTVDENGPALLTGPVAGFANGAYKVDPISGLVGWYYPLGPSVPGDLVLLEPPNTNTVSDLLRFDGQGVFFFSDAEAGETNLDHADVFQMPVPGNPQGPTIVRFENGQEGNNGFFCAPGPGQPGFDTSGLLPGLSYNIISDVPEPGSLTLAFAGAVTLAMLGLRQRGGTGQGSHRTERVSGTAR